MTKCRKGKCKYPAERDGVIAGMDFWRCRNCQCAGDEYEVEASRKFKKRKKWVAHEQASGI